MPSIIEKELPLERLDVIFDKDKFYVKLFRNLLHAVTYNDFTNVSRTPTEIQHLYMTMHSKVEKFISDHVYESIFSSSAYDALIASLTDIYSVFYTIIYMRSHITDLDIQPDEVIDNYLDMFGFKCKNLFNYIQRKEIAKVVYWYLRRKGTPSLIVKLLNMLGFTYYYVCEFDLYEKIPNEQPTDSSYNTHVFRSKLLHEEFPKDSALGFYITSRYNLNEVRAYDPLWILTDKELSGKTNITYPGQSPYYQVGVAVTFTEQERIIAAFVYAMVKKTLLDLELNEEVFKSKVQDYKYKVSFISLILGWTYILGEYFGVYDSYLYDDVNVKSQFDESSIRYDTDKKYDQGEISRADLFISPYGNRTAAFYDNMDETTRSKYDLMRITYDQPAPSRDSDWIIDGDRIYKLVYPVFGWQKDITNMTSVDIMYDIDREVKRLSSRLYWQPDIMEYRINNPTLSIIQKKDNIKVRKEKTLKEIKEIFYGPPIFGTYDKAIKYFLEHDKNFFDYLNTIMFSKSKRLALYEEGNYNDIESNLDDVLEVMDHILESIEYYIFDNTSFIIPVRNYALSFDKIVKILKQLDQFYTPYHAKLIFPMVVWLIRDLPGDQVAIEDSKMENSHSTQVRDYLWRSNHRVLHDIYPSDPYNPIKDWTPNNPNMPHIPISNDYTKPPYHDRATLQKNNPNLYSIGYDWRDLPNSNSDNLMPSRRIYYNPPDRYHPFELWRDQLYTPKFDMDTDDIYILSTCYLISAYDVERPNIEGTNFRHSYYDYDNNIDYLIKPPMYTEEELYEDKYNDKKFLHSNKRWIDQVPDNIRDYEVTNIKYNTQQIDRPIIRERIEIIKTVLQDGTNQPPQKMIDFLSISPRYKDFYFENNVTHTVQLDIETNSGYGFSDFTWESSSEAIATIDGLTGLVTMHNLGKATIRGSTYNHLGDKITSAMTVFMKIR